MNLRNYTSTMPVEKSTAAIERLLVDAGATHISRAYENKILTGFVFVIEVAGKPISFKLPANPAVIKDMMMKGIKKEHSGTRQRIQEQSERTAWKLLHDWVHCQISLIQMGQADPAQVFLSYAYNPAIKKTFYELLKENGFKALTAGE